MKVHRCTFCGVRLIVTKLPPLNWGPDPAGTAAAWQTTAGAWVARFLAAAEQPVPPEKRYSVHECEGTRHAAQRGQVRTALAEHARAQRNRRGTRPAKPVTGYVVQAERLPGMGEQR